MPSFVRNPKDFFTGLIFIAFGIGFLLIAQHYPLGSARRMGPAYFPTILSVVLILLLFWHVWYYGYVPILQKPHKYAVDPASASHRPAR